MTEINKEILEREKVYIKAKKKNTLMIVVVVVLIVYLFFFISKALIPKPMTDQGMVTKIGEQTAFAENRTYTLLSAEYSSDQKVMEIMISFQNSNYDNINDYFFALTSSGADPKDILINEVYNEDLFTVIRLENLKKNYREINLLFAPKEGKIENVTDDMTGTIILNKYNVDEVEKINLDKSKKDYLKDRLQKIIASLYEKLDRQNSKLEELLNRKTALENEISNSEKDEKYMTADELKQKEKEIEDNKNRLLETEKEITEQEKKIENTKNDIKDAESKATNL